MADIEVEFVTVERRFWSGTATMVVAKTTEGEIGIQAGHEPLLGELDAGGTVTVYTVPPRRRRCPRPATMPPPPQRPGVASAPSRRPAPSRPPGPTGTPAAATGRS